RALCRPLVFAKYAVVQSRKFIPQWLALVCRNPAGLLPLFLDFFADLKSQLDIRKFMRLPSLKQQIFVNFYILFSLQCETVEIIFTVFEKGIDGFIKRLFYLLFIFLFYRAGLDPLYLQFLKLFRSFFPVGTVHQSLCFG